MKIVFLFLLIFFLGTSSFSNFILIEGQIESEYLENGCPTSYPYLWSDDYCYDEPEPEYLENGCWADYPYLWSDDYCYDEPE